jgi:Flp pilus assembly protein TadD/predicted aspartyl protease
MNLRFLCILGIAISASAQTTADHKKPVTPSPTSTSAPAASDPLVDAQALMNKEKFDEAAAAYKVILDKNPASAEANVGLIRSLLRAHKFDEADEVARKAVVTAPASAAVYAAAGDVAFRAGKFGDAETDYRAGLKLDANSARAQFGMARMYQMVSMNRRAEDVIAKAHKLDSSDEQIAAYWEETLPAARQLEEEKKAAGDHPTEQEQNAIAYYSAVSGKRPWILVSELKPTQLTMQSYGNEYVGVEDINRDNPLNISQGYGLAVKFNQKAGAVLLLDTGASGIVIGQKLAEKAGAVKIADTHIGGIGDNGGVLSYDAWVEKINIGSLEFHNCIITVSTKNNVADEAGLIGADVFQKFLVTLDFREKKVFLNPLPKNPYANADADDVPQDRYITPEMQSFTKFYRFGHNIVVPVVVNDKEVGNFILDTGAFANSISLRFANQVTKSKAAGEYSIRGVSGSVQQVLTGQKAILQFAKMRIESHDLPVFNIDNISNGDGTEIAGFIGIRTLVQMKMTIDYRDGLVNLEVYDFQKARE